MSADSAFGDLLRRHRLAAGLTQAELAERAGLSERAISDLERGARRQPFPDTVRQLARALRLSAADRAALMTASQGRRGPAGSDGAPTGGVEPRDNLPTAITSFVGREREVADIARLLATTRFVMVTGAGGVGKSRLALEVARAARAAYPDGVWLVELAPLADPALVAQAVARALGVLEQPGRPLVETLVAALRPRRLLLVLDNCEHLLDACARLADALLGCPELRLLATSREPLAIGGELTWRVPSLVVPARPDDRPAAVAGCAAVRLFVERAGFVRPGFAVTGRNAAAIAEVCRRLDGIPLALELAAARLAALSVEQIAARLDHRFQLLTGGSRTALRRQQTLEATIEWSHELLSEPERVVFRRLAVFAGSWTLEAAEAVCEGESERGGEGERERPAAPLLPLTPSSPHPLPVFDLLLRLVGKSLVEAEERDGAARYRLLETVREYSWARLRAAGEEWAARDRHRDWCLALAEQAAPALHGPEAGRWLAHLDAEHDNLRAALAWCLADAEGAEAGLRLAGAVGWFWFVRDYHSEGRAWLERMLARGGTGAARAAACGRAGQLAWRLGGYEPAAAWLEESLALGRALGDRRVMAYALGLLGHVAMDRGDVPEARACVEEAVIVARAAGDRATLATALFHSWILHRQPGELARVRATLEESLALWRALGDHVYTAMVLSALGYVAALQGEWAVARAVLGESLPLQRALGMRTFMGRSLLRLGWVAQQQGDHAEARALYAASLTAVKDLGDRVLVAILLMRIAGLAAAEGRAVRAARLFGAAEAVRTAIGTVLLPASRADYDRNVYEQDSAAAQAALGEVAFDAAWAAGRALALEEAVAEALAEDEECDG